MKYTIIIALLVASTGCARLARVIDDTGEVVGKGVKEYCTLPLETRQQFDAAANKESAPHSLAITCR